MNPRHVRLLLMVFTTAVLAVLVVPQVISAVRLHRVNRSLQAEPVSQSILVDPGVNDPNYVQVGREDLISRMIATLAGDSPGRLGDLEIASESDEERPDRVGFTVNGEAGFGQLYATMSRLRDLWPAVRIDDLAVEDAPEGTGLRVSLRGTLSPEGVVPLTVAMASGPGPVEIPGRDPFHFSTGRVTAAPRAPDDGPSRSVEPLLPLPSFQGTGVIQGEAIAFYGGRAYRVGDRVAGRLVERIENGRVRFAPTEDQR